MGASTTRKKKSTPLRAISLYSGAGGIDYGFEAAGFETAVALEYDHDCCETLRSNRPAWTLIEESIFNVSTTDLLLAGGLKKGEADVLFGGPPCQPFSKSAYWVNGDTARLDDPRSDTLAAFMRMVEEAQPKTFLLENVGGLAYSGKDEGLRLLLDKIERINKLTGSRYVPYFRVLKATDYGVPQLRERFILIAARDGSSFRFPVPTHGDPSIGDVLPLWEGQKVQQLDSLRTAWDAIGDVRPEPHERLHMTGRWAELLPSIPEGHNYLFHTDRGGGLPLFGWRRRYWQFLLKLAKNKPSWTVQAQPGSAIGPFHWENRRLSMRELCRIQTFPDDVVISGSRSEIQRQLGNAVPSLLAETLAREIRSQLLGASPLRSPRSLLPPRRNPVPPAEKVAPVAHQFHHLMGNHTAHPGTGKGEGAKARLAALGT